MTDLKNVNVSFWQKDLQKPTIIAGPCSAESETQVLTTAKALEQSGQVTFFRAGAWKPRTSPGAFEGFGKDSLEWIRLVKEETNLIPMIEVANAEHVEQSLKQGINVFWIGARTTVNPFYVQEIADALKGTKANILVKNPIHPEVKLWAGAIERIAKAGIEDVGAIHRGFYSYGKSIYRNPPMWENAIELKTMFPQMTMICDPSHIGGSRELIHPISQTALDFNYNGLMIETHPTPDTALSDAQQQITPTRLIEIISQLILRNHTPDEEFQLKLASYRQKIDALDEALISIIAQRIDVVKKVAEDKKKQNLISFDSERWEQILERSKGIAKDFDLNEDTVLKMMSLLHKESLNIHNELFNT